MNKFIQRLPEPVQPVVSNLADSGMGTILLGMLLMLAAMKLTQSKTGKISTGRFGQSAEKRSAQRTAKQQRKQRKAHRVSFKSGKLNIPEAQQGIAVCGAPNSGKTYSIIDPVIRDAIGQGFPIVVYDFKGAQLEAHAGAYPGDEGVQFRIKKGQAIIDLSHKKLVS